jgi:hypothetical protein
VVFISQSRRKEESMQCWPKKRKSLDCSREATILLALNTVDDENCQNGQKCESVASENLDVKITSLQAMQSDDFSKDITHEIEEKLGEFLDTEGLPYGKSDMIQLISSIEKFKIRFLWGDISAKQLYCEVSSKLNLFKIQYPRFNFLNDPALNIYYSSNAL